MAWFAAYFLFGTALIVVCGLGWLLVRFGVLPEVSIKCPECRRWAHFRRGETPICPRCDWLLDKLPSSGVG